MFFPASCGLCHCISFQEKVLFNSHIKHFLARSCMSLFLADGPRSDHHPWHKATTCRICYKKVKFAPDIDRVLCLMRCYIYDSVLCFLTCWTATWYALDILHIHCNPLAKQSDTSIGHEGIFTALSDWLDNDKPPKWLQLRETTVLH